MSRGSMSIESEGHPEDLVDENEELIKAAVEANHVCSGLRIRLGITAALLLPISLPYALGVHSFLSLSGYHIIYIHIGKGSGI